MVLIDHVSITVADLDRVTPFWIAIMAAHGGVNDGLPGVRMHHHPSCYAAFLTDPDGNRLEAVCRTP